MHLFRLMVVMVLIGSGLISCTLSPKSSIPTGVDCGDGTCDTSEDPASCPTDCNQPFPHGKTTTTSIISEGIGEIAVLVAYPDAPRYPEGAGVVVVVPPIYNSTDGFTLEPDLTSIGLVQVTALWPGMVDDNFEVRSDGTYDFGGEATLQVLRDIILYASGRLLDVSGRSISTLIPVRPMVSEVGLYTFADAGIPATYVLARYGNSLAGVVYYVGYENPTVDSLAAQEAGYISEEGVPIPNPFYIFPTSYDPTLVTMNFGTLRWDEEYFDEVTSSNGRPYLDVDGNGQPDDTDHLFGGQVPWIFGKRTYSLALTQALLENGDLTGENWPDDLATPQEASEAWSFRQPALVYMDLALSMPDLKVMLIFDSQDHSQAAADKPHIHQAFQGFRFAALLRWVRLNPDSSYQLAYMENTTGSHLPDNPANSQPENWLEIDTWALPRGNLDRQAASWAALAEMSDRAHAGRWDENLGDILYESYLSTPQP